MFKKLVTLLSWGVSGLLLIFTLRRWLFTFIALLPGRLPSDPAWLEASGPSILLLVPVRNEASLLPDLLQALAQLRYPPDKLTLALVDDGSTDSSRAILQSWAGGASNRHLLVLAQNIGKANALNQALAQFPQGDFIVVYDADERPRPDALQFLLQPFSEARVGGVSGQRLVRNGLATPAASYAAFEALVHQMVTMRAKDRLKLAPAILGANCAYRRAALLAAGGFKPGALLEDSDLTLKLVRLGWQTRFIPEAISYHDVPQTVRGYWRQHTRWARGFNEVAKAQAAPLLFERRLPVRLRLELLIFSLGYLDRPALLIELGLALLKNRWAIWTLIASLLTPAVQIVASLKITDQPAKMWRRVGWLPFFFGLDVAMAVVGLVRSLGQSPQIWEERRDRS